MEDQLEVPDEEPVHPEAPKKIMKPVKTTKPKKSMKPVNTMKVKKSMKSLPPVLRYYGGTVVRGYRPNRTYGGSEVVVLGADASVQRR